MTEWATERVATITGKDREKNSWLESSKLKNYIC